MTAREHSSLSVPPTDFSSTFSGLNFLLGSRSNDGQVEVKGNEVGSTLIYFFGFKIQVEIVFSNGATDPLDVCPFTGLKVPQSFSGRELCIAD